jgi:probable HAF family extracellular repeat protein
MELVGKMATSLISVRIIGGMVAGSCSNTNNAAACIYKNGILTQLSIPSWASGCQAGGIDTAGTVYGECYIPYKVCHLMKWSGDDIEDLGTINTATALQVTAANDSGEIVGYTNMMDGSTNFAFLYKNGISYDLNVLIDSTLGWHLDMAFDINTKGQIVGQGTVQEHQQYYQHGFLLTPVGSQ